MAAITTSPGQREEGASNASFLDASKGLTGWLMTLDHKRIGIMYLISVCVAFAAGGIFALLLRAELLTQGRTLMDADAYAKMFSLHGAVMVFLFAIPGIPAALGNIILPMQLGAKRVAFPRLNLLSLYVYWAGALFGLYSMIQGSEPGWALSMPHGASEAVQAGTGAGATSPGVPMTLAMLVMSLSSTLTGINFVATVHAMRAPGLTWRRLTLFAWSVYSTAYVQILATPVLGITLLLMTVLRSTGAGVVDVRLAGDPALYQHSYWLYPAIYITVVPAMGVTSDILATFSRREPVGYMAIAMSSIGLSLLGLFVWGQRLLSGSSEYGMVVFSALILLVAIPCGVKIFNWVATLHKGSISLESPMLWALSFILLFTIGGLTGLFLGMLAVGVHLQDTYFVLAHFHYVMVGGTVTGFLGGLHYWWPKFTGKMYDEAWAKLGWLLVIVGLNVTFLVQFILGSRGMPRRYYDYLPEFQLLQQVSTIGSFILGAGFVVLGAMFVRSLFSGKPAPRNPWGSAALEWQTATPPPVHNFLTPPVVTRGQYDYVVATDEELASGEPSSGDVEEKKVA